MDEGTSTVRHQQNHTPTSNSHSSVSTEPAGEDDILLSRASEKDPIISIVMPTMNEEEGIRECITRAKTALKELQLPGEIIISDSSTDQTPEIASKMGAIVVKPPKSGYGYAYRYAFERARGDYIVMGDADTTYDFEEIPRLFEQVRDETADIVMGSRLDGDIRPGAMPPLHEYLGNPALTAFLNFFYNAGVTDAHSGFRVFTRESLETLECRSNGMEFASEMIMDAGAKGLTIEEAPITYYKREGEAKLESLRDGWRHIKFMLVNAPGYLFSIPGLLIIGLGALLMGFAYSNFQLLGQPLGIHSLIAGSLLTLVGFQINMFAILSSVAGNPIQQPRDPATRTVQKYFSLETGLVIGISEFAIGSIAASYFVFQWVKSGLTNLPLISADIVAFTLIMLGIQTIFGSFFFDGLQEA